MKRARIVFLLLSVVLIVALPLGTAHAAEVYASFTGELITEGCSAGDLQVVFVELGWSDATTGYGFFELSVTAGPNHTLVYYETDSTTSASPASDESGGFDYTLPFDLAPGTWLTVYMALTLDDDTAMATGYYQCDGDTLQLSSPFPGPDMVAIPSTAVVGTFTAASPLYFAPNMGSTTDASMDAGQSLWVYGLDVSGQFYQVLLSGQTYWVPVGIIGPNYDDVWNGTPLPTTTVD